MESQNEKFLMDFKKFSIRKASLEAAAEAPDPPVPPVLVEVAEEEDDPPEAEAAAAHPPELQVTEVEEEAGGCW